MVKAVKQVEGFSADNLIKKCKIIFSEYRLPSKIVSDMGTNFISEKLKYICSQLSICYKVSSSSSSSSPSSSSSSSPSSSSSSSSSPPPPPSSSSYNNQSNGKAEGCRNILKEAMKNAIKLLLIYVCMGVFFADKVNTDKPWITKPSHAPV